MKRIITSTLLLSALALFSACQKSEQQAPAKGESIVFTASFAPETKTVIDEAGKKSLWNQDEIRIFNGKQTESGAYESQKYVTKAINAATAEFEIEDKTATFTGDKFIAVYPDLLATNAWWDGSVDKVINHLWLVNIQRAFEGTYDPDGHVAVAYTENHELSFKNACTLLKFTIQSDNIQEIWFESNDGTKISGNFGFNTATNKIYTGNTEHTNFSHVAVKDGFAKGKTYYMSCIPAVLNSGFTIKVVANIDGKNVNGENKVYNKSITLDRNKIYNLGDITYKESTVKPVFDYGIVGGFNSWNVSAPLQFVDTDGDGIYECKDVNLKAQEGQGEGFKFVVNNSWDKAFGVHGDFDFDTAITGWYEGVYTNNLVDKGHNIKVSDTSKNWDIYIYAKQEESWGRELAFTILPAGSPTPTK
mgnify:FL=1